MAKIEKIENVAQAEEIVVCSFAYPDEKVTEALDFLQRNGKDINAYGVDFLPTEETIIIGGVAPAREYDIEGLKLKKAKGYEDAQDAIGQPVDVSMAKMADDYVAQIEDRDAQIINNFEEENYTDGAKDAISAYESYSTLLTRLNSYEDEHNPNGTWQQIVDDINAKIIFEDEKKPKLELKDTLWKTVKTNVLKNHTLSKDWQDAMHAGTIDEFLKERIRDAYIAEAAIQDGALRAKEPQGEEKNIGSDAHAKWLAGLYDEAHKKFENLGKEKFKITEKTAVLGAAVSYGKFKEFGDYLAAKRNDLGQRIYGSKLVKSVRSYAADFDADMAKRHPKLWDKVKNTVIGIRASKYQIWQGLAATGVVVATGYASWALVGYAAYAAVGSWIYPVVQRKQMELIKARNAKSADARKWEGYAGYKKAWEAIKSNKRDLALHWVKGSIGTIFAYGAAAVATDIWGSDTAKELILNNPFGHWLQNRVHNVDTASQAFINYQRAIVRSVGAIAQQTSAVVGDAASLAWNAVRFNKEEVQKSWQNLQGSLLGFGLGALTTGAGLAWQAHAIDSANAPEGSPKAQKAAAAAVPPTTDADDNTLNPVKTEEGYTVSEENGKLIYKDKDGNVVSETETKKIKGWDKATEEQKQAYVKDGSVKLAEQQNFAAEQAMLAKFAKYLQKDEKTGAYTVPTTYDKDVMGISKHDWETIEKRWGGELNTQEGADHAGIDLKDDTGVEMRTTALKNLMKYMSEHPKAFDTDNPYEVLHKGLEAHYYSVGHGYYDSDGCFYAEKYKWIEMDGKEVEVFGRYAKVGDHYARTYGDYLRVGKTSYHINYDENHNPYVMMNKQKVAVETGYAKVNGEIVQFDPAKDAKVTLDGKEYAVSSKWFYWQNDKELNAFMSILCDENAKPQEAMNDSIASVNAEAARTLASGEGSTAVGVGSDGCGQGAVTKFKFIQKHPPVNHTPPAEVLEKTARTVTTEQTITPEKTARTVLTNKVIPATKPDQGETYVAIKSEAVNPGNKDKIAGDPSLIGHQKRRGVTIIGSGKSGGNDGM